MNTASSVAASMPHSTVMPIDTREAAPAPVAVTSGQAEAMLPVMMEGGAQVLSAVPIDLAPDSRQLDIGLSYLLPFGEDSDIKFDLQHSQNYGNQAGVNETAAAISIRYAF